MRIPLAWRNLTHQPRKLAVATVGVGFAVFLMFIEMGFKHALIDSTVEVVNLIQGDIILVNGARYALPSRQRFDRSRLFQCKSLPEVEGAYPVYIENLFAVVKKVDENGYPIRVVAFQLDDPVFRPDVIGDFAEALRAPATAIVDEKSKSKYGWGGHDPEELSQYVVELSNRELQLVGAFTMGTDFAVDGNLLMSAQNYARFFPYNAQGADPLSEVDLGVLRLREGLTRKQIAAVRDELKALIPKDVDIYTRDEFMGRERDFWNTATPVGYIFNVGMVMGFIVGVIICYQIIFTDVSDHMPELATLKAMGYPNHYFVGFVIREAIYLSLLGFVPGLIVSWAMYGLLGHWTGLLLRLSWDRILLVLVLTTLMCIASGVLAVRKVIGTDPAELF